MKRFFCLLLVFSIIILCGCNERAGKEDKDTWKPASASEAVEPYAEQTIKILDQYLDFEISADEAKDEFTSLYRRLSNLIIEENKDKYNNADQAILSTIEWLYDFNIEYRSDIELQKMQDVLRVQMGNQPTLDEYNYKDFSYYVNDDDICDFIDFDSIPASISVHAQDDGDVSILLFFDYMYGVHSDDVLSYAEDILSKTMDEGVKGSISIYYDYFEQPVFSLLVFQGESYYSGTISTGSASQEYEILEEFKTIEEFKDVKKAVAEYANINKIKKPSGSGNSWRAYRKTNQTSHDRGILSFYITTAKCSCQTSIRHRLQKQERKILNGKQNPRGVYQCPVLHR